MKRFKIIRTYIVDAASREDAYKLVEQAPGAYAQSWATEISRPTSSWGEEIARQVFGKALKAQSA